MLLKIYLKWHQAHCRVNKNMQYRALLCKNLDKSLPWILHFNKSLAYIGQKLLNSISVLKYDYTFLS